MKLKLESSRKLFLNAAILFFSMGSAQSVVQGNLDIESHKFAKAKEIFQKLIEEKTSEENYFYLGNTYLIQFSPDFVKAKENFDKGLALDKKSLLNQVGLASIEMGKGNKVLAIAQLQEIIKKAKDKDAEVLFRIGQALIQYENNRDADLGIQILNKAVEVASKKSEVPSLYYSVLGDAYRLKKDAGNAMNAYDRASEVAKMKAPVLTRIGTLWFQAQKYDKSQDNLLEAIKIDPTFAPAYKALGDLNTKYQQSGNAAANYKKYISLADKDPNTVLEYAKLAFVANDYKNSEEALLSVENQITDIIKYRMKAYLDFNNKNYVSAKQNLENFLSKAEPTRVQASDSGLMGLILAGINESETDAAKKAAAQKEINDKIAIANSAKDQTLNWDEELAKIQGGFAKLSDLDVGETSPEIDALKEKLKANPEDTDSMFKIAKLFEAKNNWKAAAASWSIMTQLLPKWEPGFYQKAYALQKSNDMKNAIKTYDKFISLYSEASPENKTNLKDMVSYSHYAIAFLLQKTDKAKSLENVKKCLEYSPDDTNAKLLIKQLGSIN